LRISKNKSYAVLTGDVVGSSKFPARDRKKLIPALKNASRSVRKAFGDVVPRDIDIFRGDSWQMIVTDPPKAIRVGLYMRAAFKTEWESGKNDTRIAIGIGKIDFIPAGSISEGDGEAFRRSGTALERMKKNTRMQLALHDKTAEETANVILHLVDTIAMRWTNKQAHAVMGALEGLTQDEIAKRWKQSTSQQNVAKHLSGSGWNGIENALLYIENTLKKLLGSDTTN
jgi:hypothetical protein